MADHMAREECYYLQKLAETTGEVKPTACDLTKPLAKQTFLTTKSDSLQGTAFSEKRKAALANRRLHQTISRPNGQKTRRQPRFLVTPTVRASGTRRFPPIR
ncbi:hypothetical protein B1A75_04885 [Geobacillus sp. LEMMY01]|nr:hypothetical protein B1A75_04885 [Geobacillus sp. LEMMY01]